MPMPVGISLIARQEGFQVTFCNAGFPSRRLRCLLGLLDLQPGCVDRLLLRRNALQASRGSFPNLSRSSDLKMMLRNSFQQDL